MTLDPGDIVRRLDDELLELFRQRAEEKYGGTDQPVAALANEAMEMTIEAGVVEDVHELEDHIEKVHAIIINALANRTEYSRGEIVRECTQTELSAFIDTEPVSKITPRVKEIADAIDNNIRWDRFKYQAYELYGYDDGAVIQHMEDAMTLVIYGPELDELKRESQNQKEIHKNILEFVSKNTEVDVSALERIIASLIGRISQGDLENMDDQNTQITDWVDSN